MAPLSQVQAARLMDAAEKWAKAAVAYGGSALGSDIEQRQLERLAKAQAAFAALVASLTDSEGL
jgi:hypothetical protein